MKFSGFHKIPDLHHGEEWCMTYCTCLFPCMVSYIYVLTGCSCIASICAIGCGNLMEWLSESHHSLYHDWDEVKYDRRGIWIMTFIFLGLVFSTLLTDKTASKMGRKPTLQIAGVLIILFWSITAFVDHTGLLCFAAAFGGYGVGATYIVLPMYLSEISDSRVRGSTCSLFFLMFSAGILYGTFMFTYFNRTASCLLSLPIPVLFLLIINCSWTPESPYFLVSKEKFSEAKRVLLDLGMKEEGKYVATDDLIEFDNVTVQFQKGHDPCRHMFRIRENRNSLFIQGTIFMVQVSSSYIPLVFTSASIFARLKGGLRHGPAENLFAGVQLLGAILCFLLIDNCGRKPLLLISCVIVIAGQICLGLCFYFESEGIHHVDDWVFVLITCLFIMGYSVGLGPIPWIIMAEAFGPHIRSHAASGLVLVYSIYLISIPRLFLLIGKHLGVYMACWAFSALVSLGASFIFFLLAETRHKTIHSMAKEIEEEMFYCGEDLRQSPVREVES